MKNILFSLCGLALGLGLGLLIAWGLAPVEYTETTPASLRADFKDEYRLLISLAYTANPDLLRAQARLALLGGSDPAKSLGEQAQRLRAANAPLELVQLVENLSAALQTQPVPTPTLATETNSPTPVLPLNEASATPFVTATLFSQASSTPKAFPTLTETPLPPPPTPIIFATLRPKTPTPTQGAPFQLVKQTSFCEPNQPSLLQVTLANSSNQPSAGIELVITWLGGEEHFFTGLKPELGYGYADYRMTEQTEYALSLSAGGTRVTGLSAPACLDPGGNAYPGGIRLEFKQP